MRLMVVTLSSLFSLNHALLHTRYDSERMYRDEFVRAMKEIEDERQRETHRQSIMERILNVAKKVVTTSSQTSRRLNDQYFKYEDVNDWNIVGNLAEMAIKYTGCQNIKRWDDNMAKYGEGSPLFMDRFVMFRLCEAEYCSAYNKRGCDYNFGEYMIPMEDYLSLMAEYHFQQFSRYCKTCYHCMKLDYYNAGEDGNAAPDDDTTQANTTNYDNYSYGDDYWAGMDRTVIYQWVLASFLISMQHV